MFVSSRRFVVLVLLLIPLFAAVPGTAAQLPDTPEGTVKAVTAALADKHPEILWQALPPSYQEDITEITHTFAGKMDPELWDAAWGLGHKLVKILREKKQLLLESSLMEATQDKRQDVERNWDAALDLVDMVLTSEITQLERLRTISWERFLQSTCREIMNESQRIKLADDEEEDGKDLLAELKQTTVEELSREGDVATVRISSPDEEPEELSLTLVEGRWVPTEMAEEWDEKVAQARQALADMTEEQLAETKTQGMMMIGMVDGVLDQFAAVTTKEELEQVVQGLMQQFMGGGQEEPMSEEEPAPEEG